MSDAHGAGERIAERKISDQDSRAPVSMLGKELISNALSERFRELCDERISRFAPEMFGAVASFAVQVRDQLQTATPADLTDSTSVMAANSWMVSDTDCLSSLGALSLGEPLPLHSGEHPPIDSFLKSLIDARADAQQRFQLLAERYACPLNFTLQAETKAREHVLMRLMVSDRARLEKNPVEAMKSDDLLLRLNLVAVHAARAPDLRFLDALNYYYELLPDGWQPKEAQHNWLLVSYFALYARALAAWI